MTISTFFPEGISNRLVRAIQSTKPVDILVFGCGMSPLPRLLTYQFPTLNVLGYDYNRDKIQNAIAYAERFQHLLLQRNVEVLIPSFTSQRPNREFDVVTAVSAVHENPEEMIREMVELTAPSGTIAVLDYDMKGMPADDFFSRWGLTYLERIELEAIGRQEAHRLHTSFGLEDCVSIMQKNHVKMRYTEGRTEAIFGEPPTLHFLYVGTRA